ncbi:MAG: glycogen synthase [Chloroflexi bacterium]|nr:glycogen synthase [Chloroflexota bacterium]
MDRPLRVLLAAAEAAPFSKVGGLADVAGALPKALAQLGVDVRVVTPHHPSAARIAGSQALTSYAIPSFGRDQTAVVVENTLGEQVPVYLIANDAYFNRPDPYGAPDDLLRYHFFARAVLQLPKALDWRPDILHLNDWHTAGAAFGLRNRAWNDPFYQGIASLITIHNLRYRGPDDIADVLSQGVYYADAVNTVSPTYAREILTPQFGEGVQQLLGLRAEQGKLSGIINGIDADEFNPAHDPALASTFDADHLDRRAANKTALQRRGGLTEDASIPVIGMVGRLTDQKGFDLVAQVLDGLLAQGRVQIAILGAGEEKYHQLLKDVAVRHPGQMAMFFAFDLPLAQLIYGGSDMFLMPSQFEPCGLGQMIALRYGSLPLVRATGGLADTVRNATDNLSDGDGFVFWEYSATALRNTLDRALWAYGQPEAWRQLQRRAMAVDNSWASSAQQYLDLYQRLLDGRREA